MADVALLLTDDPGLACEKIGGHKHDGALGSPIPTNGIGTKAITEPKMGDSSVSSRTIQPGAVGLSKLDQEVRTMISAGGAEGIPGLTNFIAEGMGITAGKGLTVTVNPGRASISEKTEKLISAKSLTMDARMASLFYAQKQADSIVPVIGKINAAIPEPDNNTVAQWRFNLNGDMQVPNYAVGKSAIAVSNNLVPNGGLARTDGYIDYAVKADGTTGYYESQNGTGFPINTAEVELDFLWTCTSTAGGVRMIVTCGGAAATEFVFFQSGARLFFTPNNYTNYDTGFDFDLGKTYLINLLYSNNMLYMYIGGYLVYSTVITLLTTAGKLRVFNRFSGGAFGTGIIHFLEIRNKCRTTERIAEIANRLLIPCRYTGTMASYPTAVGDAAHEYKFAETAGNTVADSIGSLTGVATYTVIVDSEIGLGKARRFNADTNKITCGTYDWSGLSEWTIIFCGNIESVGAARPLLSNRVAGNTNGNNLVVLTDGTMSIDNSINQRVTNPLPIGSNIFCGLTYKDGNCSAYENSPMVTKVTAVTMRIGANPLLIGYDPAYNLSYRGIMEYLTIIPRAIPQAEMAQYYNSLKNTAPKDIRFVLPADAISLGTVQTDSVRVTNCSTDYKTGRREGATGGNRRAFLGFKYFNGSVILKWDNNPFGTRKIKTYFTWAQTAGGTNESDQITRITSGSAHFGVENDNTSASRITVTTMGNGVAIFNGVAQTSGYIGCYVELLEDD